MGSCGLSTLRSVLLRPVSWSFRIRSSPRSGLPAVTGAGTVSPESVVEVGEMSGAVLAPGIVHPTYVAANHGHRASRGSP
jgi:hypothetical protein